MSVDGNSIYKKNAERLSLHEMSALVRARRELWRELLAKGLPYRYSRNRIVGYVQYQVHNQYKRDKHKIDTNGVECYPNGFPWTRHEQRIYKLWTDDGGW